MVGINKELEQEAVKAKIWCVHVYVAVVER